MSAKIIQVRRGKDGKDYPATMPLPRGDRIRLITRLHELCHGLGYSQREAQAILLAEGWRRSTGSISYDLSRPMCPACQVGGEHWRRASADAAAPPPAAAEPEPAQQQPGPAASSQQHSQAAVGAGWAGPQPGW